MNREELAWAAGFYDGEGTCFAFLNNRPRLSLSMKLAISQNERMAAKRAECAT